MSDKTHIEWTDATWNPITGCSVVSPGCTNCYAMRLAGTRLKHHASREWLTREGKAGPVWTGEVRFNEQWLDQPLRWKKPRRIFVCAHGDLFHESVPYEWIDQVFAIMALAPQHTFQVLTKRADRMQKYLSVHRWQIWAAIGRAMNPVRWCALPPIIGGDCTPVPNVWLGVSVENQARANERIPLLLKTPAAVRWISAEPLLGPIDFKEVPNFNRPAILHQKWWVVAGGESGTGARPMHPDWARTLRDQCAIAKVPFLFKQWGEWSPTTAVPLPNDRYAMGPDGERYRFNDIAPDGERRFEAIRAGLNLTTMYRIGKRAAGRLLDDVLHDEYPGQI